MKMLLIDYDGVEGLLDSLTRLSLKPKDEIIDTWNQKPKTIKHEQFVKGQKVVIEEEI